MTVRTINKLQNFFGIDFGTTSSALVGYTTMGKTKVKWRIGDNTERPIPSVIAIDNKTGQVYKGREAWEKEAELSKTCTCVPSVKTILDKDDTYFIAGKEWNNIDIAAELFKALKERAKSYKHLDISAATVAIPIGFSVKKRENLRKAARMAGIEINSFISEPTAAFFANYKDVRGDTIVVVFDWGGGTLDISVIQNVGGMISELATGGLPIAGNDIDDKVARKVHSRIARKKGLQISFDDMDPADQDLLRVKVEAAKRALGDVDYSEITMNNYGKFGACAETLDYDWFAAIIEPEVSEAVKTLKKVINDSGVGLANVDRILMVGGSSNLRTLEEKLEDEEDLYDKILFPEETMWNVGEGAALLDMTPGAYYSNQEINLILSDGTPFPLLKKDEPLENWRKHCSFGVVDTTDEARIVFGGSKDIEESSDRFISLPVYGFLEEKVLLEAAVDKNNVFRVRAQSHNRPKEYSRFWNYTRLKSYYKLPNKLV